MTRREQTEAERRVREAFDALLEQGVRPTGDRIVAYLLARYGKAGSLRDLHPAFRELRNRRMQAANVARVVDQYRGMDVLQREAVRRMMDAIDVDEPGEQVGMPGHSMQEAETEGNAT